MRKKVFQIGLLTFIILILGVSCQENDTKKITKVIIEKPLKNFNLTTEKLIGRWKSNEDSLAGVIYTTTHLKQIYDNDIVSSNTYELNVSCVDDELSAQGNAKTLYIISDESCWSINTLNKKNLELTFMSRGNTLSYTRME
ncbi:hypothetical protein [Dokdonia sp. Hel_I_53]|uniref:hypothetical protein n=1 Tax=Dokdonia sp. Hel_I_53 TaxID=1566287 RepID=UPI001199ED27|nr:hypothetical protein [Dokdonia sp. Hel_I_53]TVZ52722.1 hypothetical protein OD90_1906 [Dokdonia sp. Hel_I_53]